MSFSSSDFADDTDFERFVVGRLGTHRVRVPDEPGRIVHLERHPRGGGKTIEASGGVSMGGRGVEEFRASLQPVGFGAAYKILDMLVEHVLRGNGVAANRMSFTRKNALVAGRPGTLPRPLDSHPDAWDAMAKLYVAFQEARHAVTHRKALASTVGDLEVYDDQRQLTDTVSVDEIAAFAAAIHIVAELIIEGADDDRRIHMVGWHLNKLCVRHGLPALSATDPPAGRSVLKAHLTEVDGSLRFDVAEAREAIAQQGSSFWDLELLDGERRVFVGRWEDVPNHSASSFDFDPIAPPDWLTEQVPTG
jgi:hypothetical protein